MDQPDIIIVGAGPAGSAAAIQLANCSPDLARRTLLLEKANFPRKKLCGGGITRHGFELLAQMGVEVDVPSFPINAMRLVYKDLEATIRWRNLFRIVQREEFDMALARTAQRRGVNLHEGVTVTDLARDTGGVTLLTNQGEYRARVVVGADGANSVLRQKLGWTRSDRISRLMEVVTPSNENSSPEFKDHTAVFDFTPISRGVQGYYWDFPSYRQGAALMNRGLFDSRVRPDRARAELKPVLANELKERGVCLNDQKLMGHPERWFDPKGPHAAPNIMLAGDAAGADPWLGEGISHALDFGRRASDAVIDAFARNDFSFETYTRTIATSPLGHRLRLKRLIAHVVYGNRAEWFYRLGWRFLQISSAIAWKS